jgi:hypothetical protein
MASFFRTAVIGGGLAATLAVATAVPASAQVVVVDPYYGGPGVYVGPYGGYAPGYGGGYVGYRAWDYPAGYDTGGMPYSYRDLGWQWGPPGAAPANPCQPGLRSQNRC